MQIKLQFIRCVPGKIITTHNCLLIAGQKPSGPDLSELRLSNFVARDEWYVSIAHLVIDSQDASDPDSHFKERLWNSMTQMQQILNLRLRLEKLEAAQLA